MMQTKKIRDGYVVRLDKGEELVDSLLKFARQEKITAGTISGIGAVTNVTLGYFDREKREYLQKRFEEVYELVSLQGSVATIDDEPALHLHLIISDRDYSPRAGHLLSAEVAVTGEIFVRSYGEPLWRKKDPEFGLNLLKL
jgi:predicted DNA-binding protein with PD1-like motif